MNSPSKPGQFQGDKFYGYPHDRETATHVWSDGHWLQLHIPARRPIPAPDLQASVQAWCVQCFGETTAGDVVERNWRFMEEALELVQALGGPKADVLELVEYVYGREPGDPAQEVGGVMITLSALCAARGMDWYTEAMREYIRITQPEMIAKIRAKHAAKPHRSALPGDYPQ